MAMTPDFESGDQGSIPCKSSPHPIQTNPSPDTSLIAQLVEHSTVNRKVLGSNPNERGVTSNQRQHIAVPSDIIRNLTIVFFPLVSHFSHSFLVFV